MTDAKRQQARRIRLTAHAWRARLFESSVSESERQRFEAWIGADERHAAAYDRAETLHAAIATLDAESLGPEVMRRSWRERLPGFHYIAGAGTWRGVRTVAGVAGLLLGLAFIFDWVCTVVDETPPTIASVSSYATEIGESRVILLEDGSEITLDAKSSLSVTLSERARRGVLASGAALFHVAPDANRPFVVEAADLKARVIGTRFEVRHGGGVTRVAVAEGQVAVSHPAMVVGDQRDRSEETPLSAGEQVSATPEDGLREVERVSIDTIAAWRENRLVYAGATLKEVVADAQRHADLDITVVDESGALADRKITAFFDADDIEGMIKTLPDVLPVTVRRTPAGAFEIRSSL